MQKKHIPVKSELEVAEEELEIAIDEAHCFRTENTEENRKKYVEILNKIFIKRINLEDLKSKN